MFLLRFAERLRLRRGAPAGALLVEVVQTSSGVDGLGALARTSTFDRAQRYLDWVRALTGAGRLAKARAAAGEALDGAVPDTDAYDERAALARVADLLAGLDPDVALDARMAAWQARPSRARLIALHSAAGADAQAVMDTVADCRRGCPG